MKTNIHPHYRTVVFHDTSANEYFKVGSTIKTEREIELDGETYPYVTIDVSSASHPYYTGRQKTITTEGSAARFQQRLAVDDLLRQPGGETLHHRIAVLVAVIQLYAASGDRAQQQDGGEDQRQTLAQAQPSIHGAGSGLSVANL